MHPVRVVVVWTLIALALFVACGGGGSSSRATPTLTAPSATEAVPTSTPDQTGTIRTPVEEQPASAVGRDDCHIGWLGYRAQELSLCYPPGHYAEVWSLVAPPSPDALSIRLVPGKPVAASPWGVTLWRETSYQPPSTCEYAAEHIVPDADTQLAPYETAGATGVGCTASIDRSTQFKGEVPAPFGALRFEAQAEGPEQLALAKQILATARFVSG